MYGVPRCWIEVKTKNATAAVSWKDVINFEVENNVFLAADSFDVTLRNDKLISDYLRKEMEISLWIGYVKDAEKWDVSELTHVFTGQIDGVKPFFGNQMVVRIAGRDFSARLIDCEFSVAFAERTASQIAELLATKHGLKPVVTPTTAIIEKDVYKDKKEWAILQELADREGFVCYATKDKELYFGPRKDGSDQPVTKTLVYRDPDPKNSNLVSIDFDDSMVGIINKVVVRHWAGKKKQLVEAKAVNQELIDKYGERTRVIYSAHAKTQELAQAEANKRLKELCREVVTASQVSIVGDDKLQAQKMIAVKGCGRFDGNYFIDRIRHRLSVGSGYTCELDIANQIPDTAAQYRHDIYEEHEKKY